MAVEIFDDNLDPLTSLHIAVYSDEENLIPSWWMEIPEKKEGEYYDINEIRLILSCLPNIQFQLESILKYFS